MGEEIEWQLRLWRTKVFFEKVKEARRELRPTFKTAWPYVLLGVLLGGSLLALEFLGVRQGWLTENRLWSRTLEHLGVGFLVSSIAVFGYEWSGHLNKTIHVGDKLRQELERIHLLHSSIGRDSIQQGLDEVFTPKKEGTQDVIRSLMALIDIIVKLEAQNDRNYINFISVLLDEMVVRNANILVEIDHDDGNVSRHFTLDLAECAAKLLVAQMDSMQEGGEYLVVSDVLSWRGDQLDKFQEATRRAIEKGVKVSRVFNLSRDEKRLAWSEVSSILKKHCRDAQNMKSKDGAPGYEVRFVLGREDLIEESGDRIDLLTQHFGLFVQGDSTLRIRVEKADLSDLSFSRSHKSDDQRRFRRIYDAAEKLPEDAVDTLAPRWPGAHRFALELGDEARLSELDEVKRGPYAGLFGRLAKLRIDELRRELRAMTGEYPSYKVLQLNPVEHYTDIFVQLMRNLILENSEFCVITNELIWAKDSFGRDRKYLNANREAVRDRNIRIKRVFVVEELVELGLNLERTRALLDMLKEHEKSFDGLDVEMLVYSAQSKGEYEAHFATRDNCAIWTVGAGREICTLVEYSKDINGEFKITSILFGSSPDLLKEKRGLFNDLRARAKPLKEFIRVLEAFGKGSQA